MFGGDNTSVIRYKRMKHKVLIQTIILFTFVNSTIGQKDYIHSYWPLIYKAESAIIENDLSEALSIYQNAFQSVDRVFAIDLANAAVCASKVDSFSIAFDYLRKLILKGVSASYLQEFSGFEKLRLDPKWNVLLLNYDSLRLTVEFNDRLYIKLDSLSEIDQKFRIAPGSYAKYGDTIAKIDQSNIILLREVIKTYGFPNEHILGAEYPRIDFPGEIVLHHHCQRMARDTSGTKFNFESVFYNAIRNGELDPHRMAQLIRLQGKYAPKIGQNTVIQLMLNGSKSEPFREKVNQEMIPTIDENRFLAGLESQEDYYRKAVFKLFDSRALDYELKRYSWTEIYDCDETTYNKLLNAFEPINIR